MWTCCIVHRVSLSGFMGTRFFVYRAGQTYTKYPPEIQEVLSLAPSAFPIIDRLAARVVWSIRAIRSTVEQARKI